MYRCCHKRKRNEDNFLIYLVPENLSVKPRNPVVAEHTFIVLSCNCECSNQPRWFKNNQLIHYYGPASLYMLFANGSLLINASRYATGNYSCEIRTPFWTLRSPHIKLDVQCKYHLRYTRCIKIPNKSKIALNFVERPNARRFFY